MIAELFEIIRSSFNEKCYFDSKNKILPYFKFKISESKFDKSFTLKENQ